MFKVGDEVEYEGMFDGIRDQARWNHEGDRGGSGRWIAATVVSVSRDSIVTVSLLHDMRWSWSKAYMGLQGYVKLLTASREKETDKLGAMTLEARTRILEHFCFFCFKQQDPARPCRCAYESK
jgi:hypothetical protein